MQKAFSFRLEDEKDRLFLDRAATAVGAERPATLMRSVIRALKTMSDEELRALVARGLDAGTKTDSKEEGAEATW